MNKIGLGIVIQGAVSSSFNSSLKKTKFGLLGIDNSIKKISKTKLEIDEFKKLSKNAWENRERMNALSKSLKKAGIDTKNLSKDSKLLRLSLINLKKASKIDIKLQSTKEQFSQQKASILGVGAALFGLKKTYDVTSEVLKAQGEIKSLEISKKGIDDITKAGHRMSLQFSQITAPQFIKASYDIKSGISSLSEKGVKDFTKMAATTAVATKAQVSDMTKLYALGYGIFRKDFSSDMNFGKSFSGAISASVQAFRTDGADLSAGISNVGASAKAMGVSLSEELSIIGLSKSAFDSASEAGSGYRAFLSGVGKAQEKLGLDFIDSQGKMLPMVDVLSLIKDKYGDMDLSEMDELSTAFGSTEAVKIITALIPKVDELGTAQKNINKAMEEGTSKSEKMALAMDSGYGIDKMANAISYASFTFGKVLTPTVNFAASTLGNFAKGVAWVDEKVSWLIPLISTITFGIIGLITIIKVATLTKIGFSLAINTVKKALFLNTAQTYYSAMSFNKLTFSMALASMKAKVLGVWTFALSLKQRAAVIATNLYNSTLITSGVVMGSIGSKIKALSLWTTVATAKQWLFNVALNANPIGLMITGIAALIGLGVILYKNFEPVRNLFNGIYKGGKKLLSFIGFGGDTTEPISSNKKKSNPVGKLAATAITTTSLAANPIATGEVSSSNNSKVVNNTPTYNITVSNPKNDVDVIRAIKEHEQKQRNRQYEDD